MIFKSETISIDLIKNTDSVISNIDDFRSLFSPKEDDCCEEGECEYCTFLRENDYLSHLGFSEVLVKRKIKEGFMLRIVQNDPSTQDKLSALKKIREELK